jgi:hypothetical protein
MNSQTRVDPWWAVLAVWGIVNMVNLLQSAGFLSRVITGDRSINHILGYGIVTLAIPATITIGAVIKEKSGWRHWIGPAVFILFVVLHIFIEYIWKAEFRSPMRYDILIPYLVLFFSSIFFMGISMFRINQQLWVVTVVTTVLLLVSMIFAIYRGVG